MGMVVVEDPEFGARRSDSLCQSLLIIKNAKALDITGIKKEG